MVKFAGVNKITGAPILGIGLSRENCERLLAGEPIEFDTSFHAGLPTMSVFIIGGDTEEKILFDLMHNQQTLESVTGDNLSPNDNVS